MCILQRVRCLRPPKCIFRYRDFTKAVAPVTHFIFYRHIPTYLCSYERFFSPTGVSWLRKSTRDATRHLNGSRPMNTAIAALRGTLVKTMSVAPIHSWGSLTEPMLLSTRSDSVKPVTDQRIPGFLSGLLCGLLFFRRHGRFLLFFPLTSSFFRHDIYSRYLIGDLQTNYLYIPAAWAGSMMSW